jgi:hypothetical protein
MKALGQLLIVASLVAGALSAATAYHAWLDLPLEELVGLTLNDNAGVMLDEQGNAAPLFKKGRVLTADDVRQLRRPQPTRSGGGSLIAAVRVKEFSFTRWQHKWGLTVFGLAIAGMAGGALLTRRAARRRRIAQAGAARGQDARDSAATPAAALQRISTALAALRQDVEREADNHVRLKIIVERVGEMQRTAIDAFLEMQADLVDRLGMGAAAEVLDRFAVAERQINRAWSAASDDALDEAQSSLAEAAALLDETAARLADA